MTKVIVIDRTKGLQTMSLQTVMGYCGTIKSIERNEGSEHASFVVEYENEMDANNALYLTNTIVDEVQITVHSYADYVEKQINTTDGGNHSAADETNDKKDEKKPIINKEKINQQMKELSQKTSQAFDRLQVFVIDAVADGRRGFNKLRGKEEYPQYQMPENYTINHTPEFEKKTFTIHQHPLQENPHDEIVEIANDNNLKKKPLPPIPQSK